ncbi:MAG: hypothetical protein BWY04_00038 [candidate division CPR1 bacterium ADurb.Bin160]|jgi:hypothetical protein|uniref:Uncharacterized protein n=1 Tax=candidate division CPR1 bacterium ADurb.Bin160 TaxID=1852826 RepID=A0A1V5ZRH2_9BACT|nr:MAG: hypothetical protein BWY04_00038 [candidate division CPR1 bacterium ADurb.Bin160]
MLKTFKNFYEVRKTASFKLIPNKIYRQIEMSKEPSNFKDLGKQYVNIINSLSELLYEDEHEDNTEEV